MEPNIPSLVWTLQGFCGTLKSSLSHCNIYIIMYFSIGVIIYECSIFLNTNQHHYIGFGCLYVKIRLLIQKLLTKKCFCTVSLASFCFSVIWKKCLPLSQNSFPPCLPLPSILLWHEMATERARARTNIDGKTWRKWGQGQKRHHWRWGKNISPEGKGKGKNWWQNMIGQKYQSLGQGQGQKLRIKHDRAKIDDKTW